MKRVQAPVDLTRPLVAQVGDLGDAYDAWVHASVRPRRSLRLFDSPALEALTHIPWWLVLLVWVPVAAGLWCVAVLGLGLAGGRGAGLAAAGVFAWTFLEYVLHRFFFHHRPRSRLGRRIHFLAHGIHHLDPWDPTRLVFPPLAGLLVATPVFLLTWLLVPLPDAMALMAGLLAGYVLYDMTHYYTHHGRPRSRWGRYLKAYHLAHHHKHPDRMFGVSVPLWDHVFRTARPRE